MDSLLKRYGPEGLYIEYKRELPSPPRLAKALISFSNTKGGRLVVGVEDKSGKICGVDTAIDIEEYVMNVASENCEPIISPLVEKHSFEGKVVVVIDIPVGVLKPYHLKGRSISESTHIRIGSTNRIADTHHIQQLMREALHESFDRTLVPRTSNEYLDFNRIIKYQELKQGAV